MAQRRRQPPLTVETETKHSKPGEAEYPTTNQRKPVLITGNRS